MNEPKSIPELMQILTDVEPATELCAYDRLAIETQVKRLDEMAEGWLEEARQCSVEGDKEDEAVMMQISAVFTEAASKLNRFIRAPTKPTA